MDPTTFLHSKRFALRCPVAAADIPGAGEQHGSAALMFDPADPADIAAKISALYLDRARRKSLIEEGAKIAQERTPQAYVEAFCRILDDFGTIRRCWGENTATRETAHCGPSRRPTADRERLPWKIAQRLLP